MSGSIVKWGVIGAGGFADKRFMPHFAGAESAQLHAVMVRDQARAEDIADRHGAGQAYDSVEDLLADEQIRAVYVCSPVQRHCEHVIAAARAGKHILCEKPMARSVTECERMVRVCEQAGVKLMPAFMNRFRPAHRRIREMIVVGPDGAEEILEGFAPTFGYADEIEHLSRCVIGNTEPKVTGRDGLHNVAVMRAMQESSRTGRTIKL